MQLIDLHRGSAPAPLLAFELLLAPQVVIKQAYLHHPLDLDLLLATSGSALFASASLASAPYNRH